MYARRRGGKKLEVVDEARLVTAEPPLHQVLFYDFFCMVNSCVKRRKISFFFAFWSIHLLKKLGLINLIGGRV